jgi:hypothetical protein
MALTPGTTPPAPTGNKMCEGYASFLGFASKSTLGVWATSVTPLGLDGGDPIDCSTMHSVTFRERDPRSLITTTDAKVEGFYDPDAWPDLIAIINKIETITIWFPDNSTLAFFGFLKSAEFGALTEGEAAKITLTIVGTHRDPTTGTVTPPVYTAAP